MSIVREFINLIGFKVSESQWNTAENKVVALQNKMGTFGRKATMFLTVPFVAAAGAMLKFSSDMVETQNMFNEVFKGMEDTANQWAENYSDSLNRADVKTKESLATFQSFLIGMGFTREEAFKMSKELVSLGDDMSSFKNLKPQDVMKRWLGAMSGSTEATDRLGINLKAAAIEQKALQMGINKSTQKMTEMEKATIRLSIIRDTMSKQGAIGDAARTMDEFANRLRSATDVLIEMADSFGKLIIPIANKFVGVLIKIAKFIKNEVSPTMKGIILIFGAFAAIIGPVILGLTVLISVGKAVAGAFLLIKVAATAANIPVLLMMLKFIAIGAAVAAAIALIALLIEDIAIFVKGGDSMLGRVLPPWSKFKEKIDAVYNSLFKLGQNSGPILRGLTKSWISFFETIGGFLSQFVRTWTTFFENMGGIIAKITRLASIIGGKAINTMVEQDMVFNTKGNGQFGGVGGLAVATPQPVNTGAINKTIEIKSTINTTVPEGTPEQQQKIIRQNAESSVNETFNREIRKVMSNFLEVE